MPTVLETIAHHVARREPQSPLAIIRARDAIIDTYAVMLAGSREAPVTAVSTAFAHEIGPDGTAALVGGRRASLSIAALVNGTAAHSLDFDDNFHPARAHASAVLVPALLAIAGSDPRISGADFIAAYLAGLQAMAAVGFGLNPSHYNLGWHATSTVGAIGAAAGAAVLLGADAHEIAHAMSIATSMASGPKGQFGTMVKPVHAGLAARNAVDAARMARAGLRGRTDILEGTQGLRDLTGGPEARGWASLDLSGPHIIEARGLVTKRHPCCASTHRALDLVLDLKREHGFEADDIVRIDAKVGMSALRNLPYPDPQDEMQARFSLHYCLALAVMQDRLALADFTPGAIWRPAVRALMPRIGMTAYTAEEERGVERLPHRITIQLTDGRQLSAQRLHARGAIEDPLQEADRMAKFEDCLAWFGTPAHRLPSWQQLEGMAECGAIRDLLVLA